MFLGVLINSVSLSLHLPEQKVSAFKSLLSSFATRKRATCLQLQTLVGKLSWVSHVVVGGRIFLQRILDTLRPLRRPSHKPFYRMNFTKTIRRNFPPNLIWCKYDPLRLCNFNPSNTSCCHDRRSTTAQQPLEQYVLWRKWGDFRWCYLINIWVVKTKPCDLWQTNAQT